jgi:PAS domain S-box-containing protein
MTFDRSGKKKNLTALASFFAIMILSVFITELAVMELLAPLFARLHPLLASLLDAAILVLLYAMPLWLFGIRPLSSSAVSRTSTSQIISASLFVQVLTVVFLIEFLVMTALPRVIPLADDNTRAVTDATLTIFFSIIPLWWLLFRGKRQIQTETLVDLLETPMRLFGVLLFMFFLIDLLLEQYFPYIFSTMAKSTYKYIDSFLSALCVAPVLWLFVVWPLKRNSISERARISALYDQVRDAIVSIDSQGNIKQFNPAAESIFGYGIGEIAGKSVALLFPDGQQFLENLLREVAAHDGNGKSILHHEVNGNSRDGSLLIMDVSVSKVMMGGELEFLLIIKDISDQKRMEQKALEIQAKLIETNKMTSLGLMVSGVAHEISNPNNFIMANSQLMAGIWEDAGEIFREYHQDHGEFSVGGIPYREVDAHLPQLLAGINEGARRIRDIVHNLKSFARQGQHTVESDVDVNRVATLAVSIFHHEISKFTHEFYLDLEENIPGIKGNSQQLGQVITNLLMNACHALTNKRNGVWLETRFDAENDQINISVRDEGCGMSREESARIMEPFFTTKLDSGGTGLGLFISQSIVKEHGGTMHFTSEQGKGTTFIVTLPTGKTASREHLQ